MGRERLRQYVVVEGAPASIETQMVSSSAGMEVHVARYHYRQVSIDDLLLDLQNPRHDIVQDQGAVMRELLERQSDKMLKLAKDIVIEGTNPADLPIVIPEATAPGKYIVVEGNRRVAVLRLLADPSLTEHAGRISLRRRFEDLSKEFGPNRVGVLECVVFENREEANHWIELRHTGENEGVGVVGWDAAAVARFKKGQSWMALQVVEFVKERARLDADSRKHVERLPITNLARLVNDPDVREALGLRAERGALTAHRPEADVVKTLTKVVKDVATRAITVNDIRSKAQRQQYVEDLVKSGHIVPSVSPRVSPWELPLSSQTPKVRRGRPPSTSRKVLIPTSCVLRIGHHRLNKIYRELKLLDVDRFANSAAVMLRVFLELSLEEYISSKRVLLKPDAKLSSKLRAVADDLEKKTILGKDKLKPVRVAASSRDALFSTDTLHAYVHNRDFAPRPNDLKTTWDNMQTFMEAIWP